MTDKENKKEIINLLNVELEDLDEDYYFEHTSLLHDFFYSDFDLEFLNQALKETEYLLNIKDIVLETNFGGEGQGDTFYSIYKFTMNDGLEYFIKFSGWYASYNGAEFEEWFFVEPYEKTIIDYKKVKS